ncbi:hypothetical protein B0H66DRAFT_591888 [Apodospora peruviana]|uniref:Uncharacterized protein n=1 Tax=Apodospora peruviana TaxID=516989 RepID=A0AAE0I706_9PEZI|nr:hypothetical protein B0H66DRAFT_591888 [Apodospora peruviana]
MRSAALLSATLAFGNLAVGQEAVSSTVVTLIIPMLSGAKTILGSVVSTAGPDATAYRLVCPSNTPAASCGLGSGMDMLQGPSTASWNLKLEQPSGLQQHRGLGLQDQQGDCRLQRRLWRGREHHHDDKHNYDRPQFVHDGCDTHGWLGEAADGGGARLHDFDCHFQDWHPASRLRLSLPRLAPGFTTSTVTSKTDAAAPTGGAATTSSSSTAGVPRITQQAVLAGVAALAGGAMML